MKNLAISRARKQKVGNPVGKTILVCLANYADEYGECRPSQTTIAEETELCVKTVRDWLKRLQEFGLIIRFRRYRCNGARTSDIFQLSIDSIMPVITIAKKEPTAEWGANPAARSKMAAVLSYRVGILRSNYKYGLPDNEYIREYRKKKNDHSNS